MSLRVCIPSIAVFALMFSPAQGQTVSAATSPVGAVSLGATNTTTGAYIGLQTGSDTYVTLPMTRPPAFVGVTSNTPSGSTLPISGSPGWTSNQFIPGGSQTDTFYVMIGSYTASASSRAGCLYTVTGNDASDLTVNLAGDSPTTFDQIPAGTTITVIPCWTLGTLFPAANANVSFTPTTSLGGLQTQVFVPDNASAGINRNYTGTYIYLSIGSNIGWRITTDPHLLTNPTDESNVALPPNAYVVVRNGTGVPTGTMVLTGSVVMGTVTTPLVTQTSAPQDNDVTLIRPVPVTLANTGLNTMDGSFAVTSSLGSLGDQLFVYDNNAAKFNKSPAAIYIYYNGMWQNTTTIGTSSNNVILNPGTAMVIRKAPTLTAASAFWTNAPSY